MPHGGPPGGNTRQPFFTIITNLAQARAAAISSVPGRLLTCHLPVLALAFMSIRISFPSVWVSQSFISLISQVGHAANSSRSRAQAPQLCQKLPLSHPKQRLLVTINAIRGLLLCVSYCSLAIVFLTVTQPTSIFGWQDHRGGSAGGTTAPAVPTCLRHQGVSQHGESPSQTCQRPVEGVSNVRLPWSRQTAEMYGFVTWLYVQLVDGRLKTAALQQVVLFTSVMSVAMAIIMWRWDFGLAGGNHSPSESLQMGLLRTHVWHVFTSLLPATLLIVGPTSPLVLLMGLGLLACLNGLLRPDDGTCEVVMKASMGFDGERAQHASHNSCTASWNSSHGSKARAWAPDKGHCVLIGAVWTLLAQLLFFASGHYCEFSGLRVTAGAPSSQIA